MDGETRNVGSDMTALAGSAERGCAHSIAEKHR